MNRRDLEAGALTLIKEIAATQVEPVSALLLTTSARNDAVNYLAGWFKRWHGDGLPDLPPRP
jgi:hypothetical protein